MKRMKRLLMRSDMIRTLVSLKGNARACLWPEPLWGIPYNLQVPYASLYMAALGLSPSQIGLIASINIVSQVIFAVLSGVITDKLGRRWTTVIFDTLSWSVPEFIWMLSQDFNWFVAGALFNGVWRVTETSWDLLLVDDMKDEEIMPAFSLTNMLGLISAFVAPLSKLAIDAFGFVPTMRALYGLAGVSMTIKFLLVHAFSSETQIGRRRMAATKDKSILTLLLECKDVYLKHVLSRRMLLTFGILASYSLVTTLSSTYWALLVCGELGVSEANVVLYSTLKSFVTLICVFTLTTPIARMPIRKPILYGLALYIASIAALLAAPKGALLVPALVLSSVLEAVSLAILSPTTRSLMLSNAGQEERARVCGLIYATIALLTAVFPGVIGQLAEISIRIPFAICAVLFVLAGALTVLLFRLPDRAHDA
ncbi:MAG: MFS transporter [Clostridia bacterium]|nr:MFS transporter [Clostridia bacterium]